MQNELAGVIKTPLELSRSGAPHYKKSGRGQKWMYIKLHPSFSRKRKYRKYRSHLSHDEKYAVNGIYSCKSTLDFSKKNI